MIRRLFKTGNSLVVALPREALEALQLSEGSQVDMTVDRARASIVITPAPGDTGGVDPVFARQVADFIEEYRPALEALVR